MMGNLVRALVDSIGIIIFKHCSLPEELLIDFQELTGEHSGENMAEAVWATLELYGLIRKASFSSSAQQYVSNPFPDYHSHNG